MIRIVVTPEQAKQFGDLHEPVALVDEHGHLLGYVEQPFTEEEIQEAKRRSRSTKGGRTTAEVLERLARLESE